MTTLPKILPPQLVPESEKVPDGADWIHELKYDGYRLMARVEGNDVRLYTRRSVDWTKRLPEIVRAIREETQIDWGWIDGELVGLDEKGRGHFDELQRVVMRSARAGSQQLFFQAFDAPFLSGKSLIETPLIERKKRLRKLLAAPGQSRVRYLDHVDSEGQALFEYAVNLGFEGIVSKKVSSAYRPGVRSPGWRKTLGRQVYIMVPIGFYERSAGLLKGILLAGSDPKGRPVYAGPVESGVGDLPRGIVRLLYDSNAPRPALPELEGTRGVKWLQPRLVARIEALPWIPGRYLRHPKLEALTEGNPMHVPTSHSRKRRAHSS